MDNITSEIYDYLYHNQWIDFIFSYLNEAGNLYNELVKALPPNSLMMVLITAICVVSGSCFWIWKKINQNSNPIVDPVIGKCEQYENLLSQQQQEIEELHKKLKEKSDLLKKYTTRLSEEMNHKVAADESNVENISIRNRPMNIADDYEQMCSNEWLTAKVNLDDRFEDKIPEHVKVTALFHILMISKLKIDHFYKSYWCHLKDDLSTPTTILKQPRDELEKLVEDQEDHFDVTAIGLPKALVNSVCDILRTKDDALELDNFVNDVYKRLSTIMSDLDNENMAEFLLEETVQYTKACLNFCWKMVIQRPQMEFKAPDKYMGEAMQDLHWMSAEPSAAADNVVHVYPLLYHGNNLMKKGKVLLLPHAVEPEGGAVEDGLFSS